MKEKNHIFKPAFIDKEGIAKWELAKKIENLEKENDNV